MRKKLFMISVALLSLGSFSSAANAGLFGGCGSLFGRGLFKHRQTYAAPAGCNVGTYQYQQYSTYQFQQQLQVPAYQAPVPQYYYAPAPAVPARPSCGPQGCPQVSPFGGNVAPQHGFLAMLNNIRARHGLRALAHDQHLANWASQNNMAQRQRGLGHHVNPNAYQCSAIGSSNESSALNQWMNSPAHAQILMNPNVTRIGLAGDGFAWTANLY